MGALIPILRPILTRIVLKRLAEYVATYLQERKAPSDEAVAELENFTEEVETNLEEEASEEPDSPSASAAAPAEKWLYAGAIASLGLAIGAGVSYFLDQRQ